MDSARTILKEMMNARVFSPFPICSAETVSSTIVGRCSDYILRDMPDIVNIFLTGSMEDRTRRVMDRDGISAEEAQAKIEKKDKERAEYYNYYTFGNWGVASTYHLCIDTSSYGIEGAVEIIIKALKTRGYTDEQ